MKDENRRAMYAKKNGGSNFTKNEIKSENGSVIKKKTKPDISYREKIDRLQKKKEKLSFDIWVLEELESKDAKRLKNIPHRTERQWIDLFKLEKEGGSAKLKEKRRMIDLEMDKVRDSWKD